ncbi:ABC-type polysaccharide/polyol phosphate transport system ATPase subunit [Algoriphagus ratkowskyi]|uniref:ABC-type polysaccharide/polyol phosphate transport system ATPase subunit n=1 Tax=Algoriphagus ratkowskyi TaxID=57028 RepID=A0A2W7QMU2_9BACT|nr:polysaccharide ABC transporter ATP-binding protein [Algoriphagus ratkowskyi]PZX49798.1 ABC-type polysaccharide/polyol phosphate transport system ATPase subunit [Algoriphagus ratkowskyi]TXD75482.1 ATP-binding cassette domain-containing protein [Algoriphagus ratkowskyi]
MSVVIKISNLSKRYRIGVKENQALTLAGQLGNIIKSPWSNLKRLREMSKFGVEDESVFWALKDINFEVNEGEVLGIIGKNGAGKSTLLKILSQITEPTTGKIEIKGRVASLLEVGTGFHPELSGRENIYMNGTILGMTRREINSKLDEIIDFSGVEKFIDTPVKFYSSGMKVRLGFSVAAHLEPEILIIDEVLAVGDFEFQRKCLGKMEDVAGQGRTVLFVSHNMEAVSNLCHQTINLISGEIDFIGNTREGITKYLCNSILAKKEYIDTTEDRINKLTEIKIETSLPNQIQRFGEKLVIKIKLTAFNSLEKANVAFQIFERGTEKSVMYGWLHDNEFHIGNSKGIYFLECVIPKLRLYKGNYDFTFHFSELSGRKNPQKIENVCPFEVSMVGIPHQFEWSDKNCVYIDDFEWKVI